MRTLVEILALLLWIPACLSLAFWFWQYWAGRCFLRKPPPPSSPSPRLPVSVLKPVGGIQPGLIHCLESWLVQSYAGPWEVLFGCDFEDTEVQAALQALLAKHPDCPARLVHCPPTRTGNPKVSKLMTLEEKARHEFLIVADADVFAPPDLLGRLMTGFDSSRPGLACCPYRILGGGSAAQNIECAGNNIDFWSQVTQALTLGPMDFALGATMVLSRKTLALAGGFTAIQGQLADDFHLGRNIRKQGGTLQLLPLIVDCRHDNAPGREIAQRQLRWARTLRRCRPVSYFFSILANPTLWPSLLFLAGPTEPTRQALLAGALLARWMLAGDLIRRFQGEHRMEHLAWWCPLRDLFQAGVWALAFLGNRVTWGGDSYHLAKDGSLHPGKGSQRS